MLAETTPEQFDEWQAAYGIKPWGDDWEQAAMTAAAVMNSNRGSEDQVNYHDLIPTTENLQKYRTDEVPEESLASIWKNRLGF